MADPKREELKVQKRTAVLAAVVPNTGPLARERVLDELKGLVKTAGVTVVGELVQFRQHPHPATCFGRGKVDELGLLVKATDADLIVFDNNLTPAQGKNLEDQLQTVIVDRSEVILDIFATHARSSEAMLQVELAQLLYFRTRLKRMWTHLERIEGGIGTGRGPGEKQIETDRRLIDRRVAELKRKLHAVEQRRERTVNQRSDETTVSLVGYTNAGKSTLMNALTDAGVQAADRLFATLDTRTRRWDIPNWGTVLLSDTVGFVRDLPHHLVASFRSTLEEARHADLLLHVVDASHPEAERQIHTVNQVLDEIGVSTDNMLLVLNKIDAVEDRSLIDVLRAHHTNTVTVSAAKGIGIDRLIPAVAERLGEGYVDAEIETSVGNGRLLSYLAAHGEVIDRTYDDELVTIACRLPRRFIDSIPSGNGTTVRVAGEPTSNEPTADSSSPEVG